MTPQEQEIGKMRASIVDELRQVFKSNMTIFDWDIPENDEHASAQLIVTTMQKALDDLKDEVAAGAYRRY